MQTRWNALVTPLLPDTALRDDTYRQLEAAYSGSGRHYHNLTHIRALLDTVDRARRVGAGPRGSGAGRLVSRRGVRLPVVGK